MKHVTQTATQTAMRGRTQGWWTRGRQIGRVVLVSVLVCVSSVAAVSVCACAPAVAYAQTHHAVTLYDGRIEPHVITAHVGQTVQLEIYNRGTSAHNLVIRDFYIFTQDLKPGESVSAAFTPDKTGNFRYVSDTGGQPEVGMQGTLSVY